MTESEAIVKLRGAVTALRDALIVQQHWAEQACPGVPDHHCYLGSGDCDGDCVAYAYWGRDASNARLALQLAHEALRDCVF